jgi:hypothetical protein
MTPLFLSGLPLALFLQYCTYHAQDLFGLASSLQYCTYQAKLLNPSTSFLILEPGKDLSIVSDPSSIFCLE